MKVIVIGGKGHIGTYLCPMLIENNFEVICITRGKSVPYQENPLWLKVENIIMDREKEPNFEKKIADLEADYIIDLVNFKLESVKKMVSALKSCKNLKLYVYCSSIWAHGIAEIIPFKEDDMNKLPICEYGKSKFESEIYLKEEYEKNKFPSSIIQPGQISGPGWVIINPWGNLNLKVFQDIADGKEISLPNFGMETLHHVHAEDVAQMFLNCILYKDNSVGQIFNCVSENSITTYGYAKHLYKYFGKKEQIKFLGWKEWCDYEGDKEECNFSYLHLARSGAFSLDKSKTLIKFKPKHTNLDAIDSAIEDLIIKGKIKK